MTYELDRLTPRAEWRMRRRRNLAAPIALVVVLVGVWLWSSGTGGAVPFVAALLVGTGSQLLLWSLGIESHLLGSRPSPPARSGDAPLADSAYLSLRQIISSHIASALGSLKYVPESTRAGSHQDVRHAIGTVKDLIHSRADEIPEADYVQIYLPFLEKSAAVVEGRRDSKQLIGVLQDFHEMLGFPTLEYDVRLAELAPPGDSMLQDLKVLVVDDDANALALVSAHLTRSGAAVVTASNANEGLRRFSDTQPDVILTDLVMSKESGFDFLRRLREVGGTSVPVIALSGYQQNLNEILRAGFASLISKPVSRAQLADSISSVPAVARLLVKRSPEQY